jgi:hypothetical protein
MLKPTFNSETNDVLQALTPILNLSKAEQ